MSHPVSVHSRAAGLSIGKIRITSVIDMTYVHGSRTLGVIDLTYDQAAQLMSNLQHALTQTEREPRLGPMAEAATHRPADYDKLSAEDQWAVDKSLGILDWDGDPTK